MQLLEILSSTKSVSKILFIITIVLGWAVTNLAPELIDSLCVTPFNIINNLRIYTLATFVFVEPNFILLLNHAISIHLAYTILLPTWHVKELIKYTVLANISTAVACVFIFVIVYLAVGIEKIYFTSYMAVRGLTGFDAAVFVAVVQNMPDTVLFRNPTGRYKNTHVPFSWLIVALILAFFDIINFIYIPMFCTGFYTSWCYLRFFQPHGANGTGDSNSLFGFANFFPSILQPPIEKICNISYQLLVKLKICKPVIRTFDVKSLQSVTTTVPLLESVDKERRKQKALKDLSDRLAKTKETSLLPWDEDVTSTSKLSEIHKNPGLSNQIDHNNVSPQPSDEMPDLQIEILHTTKYIK